MDTGEKMREKSNEKPNPATPPSEEQDQTNNTDFTSKEKELSFEETSLKFRNTDGIWRISLRQLAEYYNIPFSEASRKLTENRELFRDLGLDGVTSFRNGKLFNIDLSIRDAVSFLTLLNYKRYKDERREKLVRMRNWLTDNAEKILTGEMYSPSLEELERMGGVYGDHSFLTGMVTDIIRKIRKKNPHSGCPSEQEIYLEDFNDIMGPGKLIPNWRKGLDTLNGKKLTAKKLFQGSNFLAGNVRKEDNRNKVIRDIEEYCPRYKPDFMPSSKQLDPTTQTKLIEGETA